MEHGSNVYSTDMRCTLGKHRMTTRPTVSSSLFDSRTTISHYSSATEVRAPYVPCTWWDARNKTARISTKTIFILVLPGHFRLPNGMRSLWTVYMPLLVDGTHRYGYNTLSYFWNFRSPRGVHISPSEEIYGTTFAYKWPAVGTCAFPYKRSQSSVP